MDMKARNDKCLVCLAPASGLHHIIPRSAGGSDDDSNLVPLCDLCHNRIQPEWERWVEFLTGRKEVFERLWGNYTMDR